MSEEFDRLAREDLEKLPIFPLPGAALFPGADLPLHVFEPRYRDMTRDALAARGVLAVARLMPGFENDYQGRPPVFEICGAGRIADHRRHADGRYDIQLRGIARVRILEELSPDRSYRVVRASIVEDLPADPVVALALGHRLAALWRTLGPHLPASKRDLAALVGDAANAGAYADRLAALVATDPVLSQELLSEREPSERLRLLTDHLQALAEAVAPESARSKTQLN